MTDPTVLEKMKEIEAKKEKAKTLKTLNILKDLAKGIQEDKERCQMYLEQICKTDKERKQIIDWINNLPDVQLSDDRKDELLSEVKNRLHKETREIDRQLDNKPDLIYATAYNNCLTTATSTASCAANGTGILTIAGQDYINTGNSIC